MIENLIGVEKSTKVWENDFIEFFLQVGMDGSIWFHHNLKFFNKSVAKNTIKALDEFFVIVCEKFKTDVMYSYCPDDKVLKWALFNGCNLLETATVNGEIMYVVEYR